jgi:hypothetical protein
MASDVWEQLAPSRNLIERLNARLRERPKSRVSITENPSPDGRSRRLSAVEERLQLARLEFPTAEGDRSLLLCGSREEPLGRCAERGTGRRAFAAHARLTALIAESVALRERLLQELPRFEEHARHAAMVDAIGEAIERGDEELAQRIADASAAEERARLTDDTSPASAFSGAAGGPSGAPLSHALDAGPTAGRRELQRHPGDTTLLAEG